jgi:GT2 family glycosyltransferase
MIDSPKVAIVILNWNGINHLRQFLPSVLTSIYPNLEIVMGDNASTDGSVEFVRSLYPDIRIIQNDENYGFTGGYNRVLSQVDADYYILLNSDVEVMPGWIAPVISLMESDPLIAVAAPKIRSYLQKNFFEHAGAAGGFIDRYGYTFCRGRMFYEIEEDKGQYQQSGEVFWATGAAMFIKKHCWDEAGGFEGKRRDAAAVSKAHRNFVRILFKKPAIGVKAPQRNTGLTVNSPTPTANSKLTGTYKGSIVWAFFKHNKKHFTDLAPEDFL